jgi:hypothetical protein
MKPSAGWKTEFVVSDELEHLVLPPERLAFVIRVALAGLSAELAQAQTRQEEIRVEQAYSDLRFMFSQVVLNPSPSDSLSTAETKP